MGEHFLCIRFVHSNTSRRRSQFDLEQNFHTGGLGVLWYVVWLITVRSSPDRDPFISDDELKYIQSTVDVEEEIKRVIPWKSFLTSKPVYAITIAQISLNWGDNTMLTQMPSFLDRLLF